MTYWITVTGYLAIIVGMIATELRARAHPVQVAPLDDMLDRVMATRTTRLGLIAAWWWFGWHFLFGPTL
ncbi:MAG: hypothetical protein RIS25_1011 [Actinomycetota bacterium]|jgi:hypothetical protein